MEKSSLELKMPAGVSAFMELPFTVLLQDLYFLNIKSPNNLKLLPYNVTNDTVGVWSEMWRSPICVFL